MGQSFTLEEMEGKTTATEAPPKATAAGTKLDFEDLPDALKGKQLTDVIAELDRTKKALQLSEDARATLRRTVETGQGAPVREVEDEPAKPLTREQLKELITEDPLAAYDYMQQSMVKALDDHLSNRFEPLVRGNAQVMENQARDRYKNEFELFGDQIDAAKGKVDPRILTTEAGWNDIIAYIRGLPQNFEKLIEARSTPRKTEARERQVEDVGFTASRGTVREPTPTGGAGDLDETEKEIARELYIGQKSTDGKSIISTPEQAYAEYKRWR